MAWEWPAFPLLTLEKIDSCTVIKSRSTVCVKNSCWSFKEANIRFKQVGLHLQMALLFPDS